MTFSNQVLRATSWTLLGHVVGQALRLGSNLIMTRLLMPEMFGIMALANVVMIGLALFSDVGLRQAVIQSRRGNDQSYLNTVWTMQVVRGACIWAVATGIAILFWVLDDYGLLPPDSAYSDDRLPLVLAALAFTALISGFSPTRALTASRNLALGKLVIIELVSQFVGMLMMVAFAVISKTIWALVAGSLCVSGLQVLLSAKFLPGTKNEFQWDKSSAKEVVQFGQWVFLSSIVFFMASSGDRLLLGRYLDATTLGIYSIAAFLILALHEMFLKLAGNVAFPVLSQVAREAPYEMRQTYYRLRLPLDIATLLSCGLLFSAGHLLIELLYDARYLAAGLMVKALSILLFETRYGLATQCFLALGKPKLNLPIVSTRLILLLGLMPALYATGGVERAVWAVGLSAVLTIPLVLYIKSGLGLLDMKNEIKVLPVLGLGYLLGMGLDLLVNT